MEDKLSELKKECPSIETKSIVADFSKMHKIEQYKTMIADKCVGMDIALVVVNAGVSLTGPFADLNNEEVE
jgi:short-subunit dehydrogenase